jgi:hypothetical protein
MLFAHKKSNWGLVTWYTLFNFKLAVCLKQLLRSTYSVVAEERRVCTLCTPVWQNTSHSKYYLFSGACLNMDGKFTLECNARIWLEIHAGILHRRQWTFRSHKRWVIFEVPVRLLDSQQGLSAPVSQLVSWLVSLTYRSSFKRNWMSINRVLKVYGG